MILILSASGLVLPNCKQQKEDNSVLMIALALAYIRETNINNVLSDNGTVYIKAQNLTWEKCSQIDTAGTSSWNQANISCASSAGTFQYCSVADSSCDNGTILNGTGNSEAWSACKNSTLAGRSWRVPTITELQELRDMYPADLSLLEKTGGNYWSSSAANTTEAWGIQLDNTNPPFRYAKNGSFNVLRCVSDGP